MQKLIHVIIYSGAVLFLISCDKPGQQAQNLIINGSAEFPKYDSTPPNWTNVQGHWVSSEGDSSSHYCTFAQKGKYLFFPGNDTLGILQQDVNVSDYRRYIDDGKQKFVFSGYVQSLDQGPGSDQAQVTLAGTDSLKAEPYKIFASDSTRSLNKWLLIEDTFSVPVLTRFIRIQLRAIRHVGGDNDGYFDNMTLTALPVVDNYLTPIIIAVIVCLLAAASVLVLKVHKRKDRGNVI